MGRRDVAGNLYDPRRGGQPIRIHGLRLVREPIDTPRINCFFIYFIRPGGGTVWVGASKFAFSADSLLLFVPYSQVRFLHEIPAQGEVIQFHANFLCVETFHAEAGCSGI